jgi:hypothetical protein
VVVGVLGLEVSVVSVGGGGISTVGIVDVGGSIAVVGAGVLVGMVVGTLPVGAVPQPERVIATNVTRTMNVYLTDLDTFPSLYDNLIELP